MKTVAATLALVALAHLSVPALADEPAAEVTPAAEVIPAATPEGAPAPAAEEAASSISWTVELDLVSAYVWRGILLSLESKLFKPALQPYAEISFADLGPGSLTLGLWMNKSLSKAGDLDDAPWEFDPYFSYTIPISKVDLKLGYIGYLYPDHDDYATGSKLDQGHEFLAQGTFNLDLPVTPFVVVYVEPIRQNGVYAAAGASHSATVGKIDITTTLNLGVSMYKYEDGAEDDVDFGLQDITLSSRGSMAIGESGLYAALAVAVAYSGRDPGQNTAGDDIPRILPYVLLAVGFSK